MVTVFEIFLLRCVTRGATTGLQLKPPVSTMEPSAVVPDIVRGLLDRCTTPSFMGSPRKFEEEGPIATHPQLHLLLAMLRAYGESERMASDDGDSAMSDN